MTAKELTITLKKFFKEYGVECPIRNNKLLVGGSFELFVTLKGENRIKFSVEVWKEGDCLDGLEMTKAISQAKLRVLKLNGFEDVFCDCIILESVLDLGRVKRSPIGEQDYAEALRKRIVAVLKDVINLESLVGCSITDFCIDTYFSGKSISAYVLLDEFEKKIEH